MPIYSYYKKYSFEFCKIFSGNFFYCIKCIRLNYSKCNIISSFSKKLCNIAIQHQKLEDKIKRKETKLLCLH
ncbi:hypothetical protein M406DRAFT_270247 [Cryphonectria parasitica EP155]|uniref:Uncharacterized protein n=1 Tax=Cryphonectria parasitica (strain ATCC 38755 / EP155) TaxID=660469 RepID=A0A9P4XP36_CRYP1|nr:uncharacterized protein M406DRAFT_270247 [Cryphonectria parasitica EP155]KAF3759864.1 hypothetical protein M406DRAFT_270247 [Cryphonectria parasitica EP155]